MSDFPAQALRGAGKDKYKVATVEESFGHYGLADMGVYFRAINPTPGTGIAQGLQASFVATDGLLVVRNGDAAPGTKRIYMDYVRLIPTVVPASATRSELLIAIDDIARLSAGGSALTARNVNMDETVASIATVTFGDITLNAEGANVRRISRAQVRTAILVAFEEVLIPFSEREAAAGDMAGAGGLRLVVPVGPAVLGPGDDLVLHLWHPANAVTGASWEVEVAWWQREKP